MIRSFTYNYILSQKSNGKSIQIGFHRWSERKDKIRSMLEGQLNGKEVTSGLFTIRAQTRTGENKIKRELEKMNARHQSFQIYGQPVKIERSEIEVDASLEKDRLFVKCQ